MMKLPQMLSTLMSLVSVEKDIKVVAVV